jgi:hypothetical protein
MKHEGEHIADDADDADDVSPRVPISYMGVGLPILSSSSSAI